jgi:TPR repeat protein
MYNKKLKLPIIIIAIGLAVAIISSLIISIMKEPVIKEQEFDYSVTYKLDGEVKTYEGGFRCSFIGYDTYDDPTLRLYDGVHTKNGETLDTFYFTIAEKEGVELSIVIDLDAAYMMGECYYYGVGVEQSRTLAVKAFERVAMEDDGDEAMIRASLALAHCLEHGAGTGKDIDSALVLYKKAAE